MGVYERGRRREVGGVEKWAWREGVGVSALRRHCLNTTPTKLVLTTLHSLPFPLSLISPYFFVSFMPELSSFFSNFLSYIFCLTFLSFHIFFSLHLFFLHSFLRLPFLCYLFNIFFLIFIPPIFLFIKDNLSLFFIPFHCFSLYLSSLLLALVFLFILFFSTLFCYFFIYSRLHFE